LEKLIQKSRKTMNKDRKPRVKTFGFLLYLAPVIRGTARRGGNEVAPPLAPGASLAFCAKSRIL
jgi:hypothetical protein